MIIQNETSEHLWAICTNHDDTNASLCINKVDKGKYKKGYAYCFGCSYTCQFSEKAVDAMSNKKSICRKRVPVDWHKLCRSFIKRIQEVSIRLSDDWLISISVLKSFMIGWDGEAYTFPMFDEERNTVGIQRRFTDNSKRCVSGSQLGLFLADWNVTTTKGVVVCEGLSDAAIATHLGYCGIGKPSAGFGEDLVRKYLQNIKYDGDIIIVQDNDSAGRRSRVKLQMCLTDFNTRFVVPTTDLKDFYLKNGRNNTKALLRM